MLYIFLGCVLFVIVFILCMLWNIQMDLCHIIAQVERTYDIVNKWAIYYVCEEHGKGNNEPFDYIFPNDREKIEQNIANADK